MKGSSQQPPTPLPATLAQPSVFLAGSIEMGRASQWQQTVEATLEPYAVTILNPRRNDWDPTWEQSIAHPQFVAQVSWELEVCARYGILQVPTLEALCAAVASWCAQRAPASRRRR